MISMKSKKGFSRKLLILFSIAILGLIGVSGAIYKNRFRGPGINPTATQQAPTSQIVFSPPTEEELDETAAYKESLANQHSQPPTDSNGKAQVSPTITSVSQSELRAYVSGIVEDGGVCVATFRQGANTFTAQSKGFKNVSTTICETIRFSRTDFVSAGEWMVTLSYTSQSAYGTSQPVTFEVK